MDPTKESVHSTPLPPESGTPLEDLVSVTHGENLPQNPNAPSRPFNEHTAQSTSSNMQTPPVGDGDYVSSEHQTEIEDLGNKMDLLHLEEGKLDRRCEEISTFFITNIEVYIAMTGVWFLGGIIISNTRTLLFLLGMITIAFGTGIGIAAYTSFRKLKRMRWKMHHIRRKRDKLRARVHELQTLLNNPTGGVILRVRDATKGVTHMVQVLDEHGVFNEEHMQYLIIGCTTSVIYLVASVLWTYFMHAEVHGGVQVPVYLHFAT